MTKEQVQEIVSKMPAQFDIDDLFERIIVVAKIEEGLEDVRQGRVLTTEQVKDNLRKHGASLD